MKKATIQAVVVLSGGQDSATCLALAVKKYGASGVAAITFSYGQRHSVETKYARRLAKRFGVAAHKVVRLGFYRDITTNALMDPTMAIVAKGQRSKVEGQTKDDHVNCLTSDLRPQTSPPNTVVEGRNAFFLLAAAVWSKSLGETVLYTGVSQTDYSGYPDCRAVFVKAQEKAIRLALDWPIKVVTPFMRMTKAEEWALAAKLGIFDVIANETVTCYNGIPGKGCGKCPACKLRNRGLREYSKSQSQGQRSKVKQRKSNSIV